MTSLRPAGARRLPPCLAAALLLIVPACAESGPAMGRVSGTVKYKGRPVTKGNVAFIATDGNRMNASGTITPDGNFTLHTPNFGSGAILGDYDVAITGAEPPSEDGVLPGMAPLRKKETDSSVIPKKYEDPKTSGLKETVKSGTNTFDFDLK
jgi:hypothetical protein